MNDETKIKTSGPYPFVGPVAEGANPLPMLIDEKRVSSMTGIPVRTLQHWRHHQRGPRFVKISARCVRYRLDDVRSWLDEHTRGGADA
jgi:predicted DNA-binding transcriptional regulator AlpA